MTDQTTIQAAAYPRRTERKRQTRERILCAAGDIFQRVGYSRATMADIADAADIHVTTLFTHFKAKRDLAAAIGDNLSTILEGHVEKAIGNVPFFQFFRKLATQWARACQGQSADENIAHGNELRGDPELAYTAQLKQRRDIQLYARYLAHDLGLDMAVDPRPFLAASMLMAGTTQAYDRWLDSKGSSDILAETIQAVDAGEALVGRTLTEPFRPAA